MQLPLAVSVLRKITQFGEPERGTFASPCLVKFFIGSIELNPASTETVKPQKVSFA